MTSKGDGSDYAKLDCRHFVGEKPCHTGNLCPDCGEYDPMEVRILVIKLAALGDVLRTTSIVQGLRERYSGAHITWVTDSSATSLLQPHPGIDRVVAFGHETTLSLTAQRFDLLLCFDKEHRATGLAEAIEADQKRGFGLSAHGTLRPLNEASVYAFRLGFDDELKFEVNDKTYPELIYEMAELDYQKQTYAFEARADDMMWARQKLKSAALERGIESWRNRLVGLNPGTGPIFRAKAWPTRHFAELASKLWNDHDLCPVVLGGRADKSKMNTVLEESSAPVLWVGCNQSLRQYAALIAHCSALVTGDTLGMHFAIAQRVPSVVAMGPTASKEIELYGKGEILDVEGYPCSPCYLAECDPNRRPTTRPHCLETITPAAMASAVLRHLEAPQKASSADRLKEAQP